MSGRPPAELSRLAQLGVGYRGFRALTVAVELGVFRRLGAAGATLGTLGRKTGVGAHHLAILLDALAALGFLRKAGGRYRHTRFSREWLRPDGGRSIANNLRYQEFLARPYAELLDTVRNGRPRQGLGELLSRRPEFVRRYILGMAEIAGPPSRALAAALDLRGVRQALDVGGGHGLFTLALLDKNRGMSATILDVPETLRYAREFAAASPHGRRVAFRAGDYRRCALPAGRFDLVLMSHVTHDESPEENRRLFRRARATLREGGRLVIHDFMTGVDGTRPLFSALFSLHLATYTVRGRAYSERDYRVWLKEAGFRVRRRLDTGLSPDSGTVALIASRS